MGSSWTYKYIFAPEEDPETRPLPYKLSVHHEMPPPNYVFFFIALATIHGIHGMP